MSANKPSENPWSVSYEKNVDNNSEGNFFKLVPRVVQNNLDKKASLCYKFDIQNYPKAILDSTNVVGLTKPGFRVALLASNSITKNTNLEGAILGTKDARRLFFKQTLNTNEDFILFSGSETSVNGF